MYRTELSKTEFELIESHWKSFDDVLTCIAKLRKCMQQLRFHVEQTGILIQYYECSNFEGLLTEDCRIALEAYKCNGTTASSEDYNRAVKRCKRACGNDLLLASIIKEMLLGVLEYCEFLRHNLFTCLIRKEMNKELRKMQIRD